MGCPNPRKQQAFLVSSLRWFHQNLMLFWHFFNHSHHHHHDHDRDHDDDDHHLDIKIQNNHVSIIIYSLQQKTMVIFVTIMIVLINLQGVAAFLPTYDTQFLSPFDCPFQIFRSDTAFSTKRFPRELHHGIFVASYDMTPMPGT